MISECSNCQFYSKPQHSGDIACAVQPSYAAMWQRLSFAQDRAQFPIESCSDFIEKLPYDLDAPCIRRSPDGMWNLMNRIRKGWGETAHFYPTLQELLSSQGVVITGQYADEHGEFYTIEFKRTFNSQIHRTFNSQTYRTFNSQTQIEMRPVTSSCIQACGYDADSGILQIQFINNSRIYQYHGVPASLWEEFQDAQSKGSFFGRHIRNQFVGEEQ